MNYYSNRNQSITYRKKNDVHHKAYNKGCALHKTLFAVTALGITYLRLNKTNIIHYDYHSTVLHLLCISLYYIRT
jgi:hypothetical protein